ncbi:MAG TPA: hypothetical protein VNT26_07795 [Candidatus Sulfotelmatobacter sp.]|nr:hypothetical protein [Candidatus Sulfotelmatobacter sp.]
MKGEKLAVIAIALWGCIAQHNTVEAKTAVERIPTRSVSVSHAYTEVHGEKLTVTGRVSRWHRVNFPGHVDVEVYDPKGNLLSRNEARLPLQIMSKRGGRLDLPFSSTFDFVPPGGSIVRVRYHSSTAW